MTSPQVRSLSLFTFTFLATFALLAAIALAAPAPVTDQYGNPVAGDVAGIDAGAGGEAADDAAAGEALAAAGAAETVAGLPFTGMELTALMLAGAFAIGSGVVLRKVGFAPRGRGKKRSR